MNGAVVTAQIAAIYNGFRSGVNMVMFTELNDGTFYAPAEIVDLVPEAFPEYTIREVLESEIKVIVKTRQQKIDELTAYMNSQLADADFKTFITDARNHLIDYSFGSETLYFWISTSNGGTWGNYTTSGFTTKSYGSVVRKNAILDIIS